MARIKFNLEEYEGQFRKAGMERVIRAAFHLQLRMQTMCIKSYDDRRPVYKTGKDAGKLYTARDFDIMAKTIRVVEKPGKMNVRVYVGNYKTWWALQMEYGRGSWKGGPRPFIRRAISKSRSPIRAIIESGSEESDGR